MNLCYEGSDGNIVDLMGDGIYAQNPETLNTYSWSYSSTSSINNFFRVKKFYKEIREASLKLSIMCDDAEEFNSKMYEMHRTFEKDIKKLKPGRLWWNGFYREAFAIENTNEEFDEFFESIEKTINFLFVTDSWIKETEFFFLSSLGAEGLFDYGNTDYPFDYDMSEFSEHISNDCIENSNFELIFFGPFNCPSVTIGKHKYELNANILRGEYVVVNSITKKITKYYANGEKENAFSARSREHDIFQKIPEGNIALLRPKNLTFKIKLFDERGESVWI